MTDVVVERCVLRIRRTSGWAWGASADQLLAAATRALPSLIGAQLLDAIDERTDEIRISTPVAIRVAATTRELARLADESDPANVPIHARIATATRAAAERALASAAIAVAPATEASAVAEHGRDTTLARLERELAAEDAPRRAARAWWRTGQITSVLARLEPAAIERVHALLLGDPDEIPATVPAEITSAIAAAIARLRDDAAPIADRTRARIALAAAVLDAVPEVHRRELRAAIDAAVPAAPEPAHAEPVAPSAELEAPSVIEERELEVRSALPFLLVPALHHAGWLATAATLIAPEHVFVLAAGLAASVLDPLERGWVRSPADRLVIAAFAGRAEPIADATILAAASKVTPACAALDAALRAAIARGRRAAPLVLWCEADTWWLIDTDGMVALVRGSLATVTAAIDGLVIVPGQFASPAALEQLDSANRIFVTDAPATRDEPWRPFAGTTGRLTTNDTATPAGKLVALTASLDDHLALAGELVEVIVARPPLVRHSIAAFDATCGLAATAALADLGARLFPRETTTPVLALTRFRDLDARVTLGLDTVRVRVPLGRRHAELMRAGVLGPITGVPWLDGRTLDLGGG